MSRRMDRVNALLREEISRVVASDLKDPRLSSMVTVTLVDTSGDLRHARVFFSVLGDRADKLRTLKALKSAAGYIHRHVRQNLTLKVVPSLEFHLDDSIERGNEILEMIREVAPGPATE